MQPTNVLGIYLAKDHATVVCLAVQGRDRNFVGCFSVSIEQDEQPGYQVLAQVAPLILERQGLGKVTAVLVDKEYYH